MNGVRIGIGLYGATNNKKLKEISSLTSVITQITKVKKGFIGYGLRSLQKYDYRCYSCWIRRWSK